MSSSLFLLCRRASWNDDDAAADTGAAADVDAVEAEGASVADGVFTGDGVGAAPVTDGRRAVPNAVLPTLFPPDDRRRRTSGCVCSLPRDRAVEAVSRLEDDGMCELCTSVTTMATRLLLAQTTAAGSSSDTGTATQLRRQPSPR